MVLDDPEIEVFPDNAVTTKELIAAECAMICARQCTRNRLLLSMHRFSSMLQEAHHEGQVLTPSTNTYFNLTGNLGSKPILGKSAQETQTPHTIRRSMRRMRRTTRGYFSSMLAEASNVKRNSGNSDHTFCAPHTDRSQLAEKCAQSAGAPHGRIRHASNKTGYSYS